MGAQCASNQCCRNDNGERGDEPWNDEQRGIGELEALEMDGSFHDNNEVMMNIDSIDPKTVCTVTGQDSKVGDHICPVTSPEAASAGAAEALLHDLLRSCKRTLMHTFDLTAEEVSGANNIVCAVSQPMKKDCPLTFVSDGFQQMTGYLNSFALGRSCRFLQPLHKGINDAINLKDRQLMREFSMQEFAESYPPGTEIVNLLMNERVDGPRFWNLLKMVYVEVQGEPYIFAVQTVLDAYMPAALRHRVVDKVKNETIIQSLTTFSKRLNDLRDALADRKGESIFDLAAFAKGFLDRMIQKSAQKSMVTVNAMSRSLKSPSAYPSTDKPKNKLVLSKSRMNQFCPSHRKDRLVLNLSHIENYFKPVPKKFIAIGKGNSVEVSCKNISSILGKTLLKDTQLRQMDTINILTELVVKEKVPYLQLQLVSENKESPVTIDGSPLALGAVTTVGVGAVIALGEIISFRVGSLKALA